MPGPSKDRKKKKKGFSFSFYSTVILLSYPSHLDVVDDSEIVAFYSLSLSSVLSKIY